MRSFDLVGEARQRLQSEYQANDLAVVGEKQLKAIQEAPASNQEGVRRQATQALALAKLRRDEIRGTLTMSDKELLEWLKEKGNFDGVFPEKAELEASKRQMIFDEWSTKVLPDREWNERTQYANIDYRQMAMELVALTALCGAGFVMTIRTS